MKFYHKISANLRESYHWNFNRIVAWHQPKVPTRAEILGKFCWFCPVTSPLYLPTNVTGVKKKYWSIRYEFWKSLIRAWLFEMKYHENSSNLRKSFHWNFRIISRLAPTKNTYQSGTFSKICVIFPLYILGHPHYIYTTNFAEVKKKILYKVWNFESH